MVFQLDLMEEGSNSILCWLFMRLACDRIPDMPWPDPYSYNKLHPLISAVSNRPNTSKVPSI